MGPEHRAANALLAAVVDEIADEHAVSPAQVALAWLLARRPWIVPIPGTKRAAYVEDNARATELQLSAADVERLEALSSDVQGARYAGSNTPTWVSPPLPA